VAIFIDQMVVHVVGSGDDTRPPGITGDSWCHAVSTTDLLELELFLTTNAATILCPPTNIRTPLLGSRQTYVGLNQVQLAAAIAAGASPRRQITTATSGFDSPGTTPYYEP